MILTEFGHSIYLKIEFLLKIIGFKEINSSHKITICEETMMPIKVA
jgi:hypothetical protein